MSTHPYIPLYVDDYDAATAHLSLEEDGAYMRLLRLCWRTPGCSLPNDKAWIARKVRLSPEDFARVAEPVLSEFFRLQRGRLVQRRLKDEYDDISRKKSARKLAGKKGGAAKALKNKDKAPSNASILPADTRAFPEPYPEPEEDTPVVPKGDAKIVLRQADVEAVWECASKLGKERSGKEDIKRALQAAARRGHQPADVIAGVRAYFASDEATRDGGQYAKGAHRIIQQDRWQNFEPVTVSEPVSPDDLWRSRVRAFRDGSRYWNTNDWEAPPGKPGCVVPPAILAEFGFAESNVVSITSGGQAA